MTTVETDSPEVGVLIDAPPNQVGPIATLLAGYGMHASFGLAQSSLPLDANVIGYGDQALPRLPNGGLVRWMGARGELHQLIGPMGFHHHFLYTSNAPSLGQWLVAHGAGGRLIAGAVRLSDGGDPLGRLRAGEVIELRITSPAEARALLGRLRLSLASHHLRAVPVGRLMRDAGTAA